MPYASPEGHGPLGMAEAARLYVEHVRGLRLREIEAAAEVEDALGASVRCQRYAQGTSGGGPAHGDDAVFSLVEEAGERLREWEAAAAELAGERREFEESVARLADPRHRHLLKRRAQGATWREIGGELHYSKRQTLRLADSSHVALWCEMPEPWRRKAFPDAEQ